MDENFEEWAQSDSQQSCVRKYADQLLELGTSWNSFCRPDEEIVKDFVEGGGIPLLAARDIVKLAKEEIQRGNAPMAIFWDLENMPIPASRSGRDVTTRLKKILAPYGNLVQFRAYASIGLNLIPQKKRSDLQLSGCHLVDCPHNGRKEVADKMIIVDAMQFAYTNPDGATLCFITGDVDYAYLLAVLHMPKWRTIVISKGTMSSMLHVNCDMRMRWETDILLLRPTEEPIDTISSMEIEVKATSAIQVSQTTVVVSTPHDNEEKNTIDDGEAIPLKIDTQTTVSNIHCECDTQNASDTTRHQSRLSTEKTAAGQNTSQRFEALTPSEEWTDDVELLRSLLKSNGNVGFKRTISNQLKATNPARFPNPRVIKSFLAKAIEAGVVVEIGQGHYKELALPSSTERKKLFPISKILPRRLKDIIPDRVPIMAKRLPFVLFCPVRNIPSGTMFSPAKTFVHKTPDKNWLILMFASLEDAHRVIAEELRIVVDAILVDWNTINLEEDALVGSCCRCCEDLLESEVIYSDPTEELAYCSKCYQFNSVSERRRAVARVTSMLAMMAENDEVYISRKLLRKLIYQRYIGLCTTHRHAEFWIDEAVCQDKVTPYKREGQKKLFLCLPSNLQIANGEHPPENYDTSKEEKHIADLLENDSSAWISRCDAIKSLKKAFLEMSSPLFRSKVFQNGHANKIFFVARGPFGQTIGATEQEAQDSLEAMTKAMREEVAWNLGGDATTMINPAHSKGTSQKPPPGNSAKAGHLEQVIGTTVEEMGKEGLSSAGKNKMSLQESILDSDDAKDTPSTPVPREVIVPSESKGPQNTIHDEDTNIAAPMEWDAESIDSAILDARLRCQALQAFTLAPAAKPKD